MRAILAMVGLAGALSLWAEPVSVWTDAAKAKAENPAFSVQGEYTGDKVGVQLATMPGGKMHRMTWPGGLPGDGWNNDEPKSEMISLEEATTYAAGLKSVQRSSPTLGAKPPAGAVVLFDGKAGDLMTGEVKDDCIWAGASTRDEYGSFQLHIEFCLPYKPERALSNQDRGNSGIYIYNRYEVQVLDSFSAPPVFADKLAFKQESHPNQWCASLYKTAIPSIHACRPPLAWQTYDIDFTAPKFENDKKVANARITVRHNGILVHDNLELQKGTGAGGGKPEIAKGQIFLQNHGNPTCYRNIWLVPATP